MTGDEARLQLRRHFLDGYHPCGPVRVFDCAGNAALWDSFGGRVLRVGYDAEAAGRAGVTLSFESVDADVIDVGGSDPWGLYADILAGFRGSCLTVFLLVPSSTLRLDGGVPRFVWERAGIPFDWTMWNGPVLDAVVLRAGLSYAEDRGFVVEEAVAAKILGKPFPGRYNYIGVHLRSRWSDDGEGSRAPGLQGQGGPAGGESAPPRP